MAPNGWYRWPGRGFSPLRAGRSSSTSASASAPSCLAVVVLVRHQLLLVGGHQIRVGVERRAASRSSALAPASATPPATRSGTPARAPGAAARSRTRPPGQSAVRRLSRRPHSTGRSHPHVSRARRRARPPAAVAARPLVYPGAMTPSHPPPPHQHPPPPPPPHTPPTHPRPPTPPKPAAHQTPLTHLVGGFG